MKGNRVLVPTFEIASNPKIKIATIKNRYILNILDRINIKESLNPYGLHQDYDKINENDVIELFFAPIRYKENIQEISNRLLNIQEEFFEGKDNKYKILNMFYNKYNFDKSKYETYLLFY